MIDDEMSLLDAFAGSALAGLCANPGGPFQANDRCGWMLVNCSMKQIASTCYDLADAMATERQKRVDAINKAKP